MNNLIHTINKFNGNICFAGSTDSGDYVFECDRDNRALSYATSTRLITGVCPETSTSYLVAFSNPMIGQYSGGVLTENYINSGMTDVRKITGNSAYGYFFFNSLTNELVKYDGGIIWTYSLPDFALRYQGDIIFRESDRMVLYYNNSNVHFIRDDLTSATLMNTLAIDGDGDMIVGLGSQWNPAYCYARYRQVTGTILDQSSSSSSSSSSYGYTSSSSESDGIPCACSSYSESYISGSDLTSYVSLNSSAMYDNLCSGGCDITVTIFGLITTSPINYTFSGLYFSSSNGTSLGGYGVSTFTNYGDYSFTIGDNGCNCSASIRINPLGETISPSRSGVVKFTCQP